MTTQVPANCGWSERTLRKDVPDLLTWEAKIRPLICSVLLEAQMRASPVPSPAAPK